MIAKKQLLKILKTLDTIKKTHSSKGLPNAKAILKENKILKSKAKNLKSRAFKINRSMDNLLDEDKEFIKGGPKAVKAYDKGRDKVEKLMEEAEEVETMSKRILDSIKTKKAAGGIIKKGIKAVVKRGRKSRRGRPKKEVVKKVVKKQDPSKIKKLPGESDAAFKKRRTSINKLKKEQQKEIAKERGTKEPSTKDRTSRSMTIPLKRKEQSKAAFRRRVMQGLQGVTKKGESKDIGKAGYPVSETMRDMGYTGSRKGGVDLTDKELEALGFQIKKAGGMLKSIPTGNKGLPNLPTPVRNKMGFKKRGGKIKRLAVGGGIALRGLGVTRKK
tara:strand:+ start:1512 stop:2501 length:990 start_codon:yes stop_codon:yes gene_type:complete